jgi:hypothetical protein
LVNKVKAYAHGAIIPIGSSLLVPIDHVEVPEGEPKLYDVEKYTHIIYMPLKPSPKHHITLENLKLGLHSMVDTCYKNNITHISMPIISVVPDATLEEIVNAIQEIIGGFIVA